MAMIFMSPPPSLLVPTQELRKYGVENLLENYQDAGFKTFHLLLMDQKACGIEPMSEVLAFIDEGIEADESVLVHCVGGLGRSGMVVASWLKTRGADSDQAIAAVRKACGSRAIETEVQVDFVREFSASLPRQK